MSDNVVVRRLAAGDYGRLQATFADLCSRAESVNPHMAPAAVLAAAGRDRHARIIVLCAWRLELLGMEQLVGVWALRHVRSLATGFAATLTAPLVPLYEVSSAPVLDREHALPAARALLRLLAASPDLPRLLHLPALPLDDGTAAALRLACAETESRISLFERWQRPVMRAAPGESAEAYLRRALGSHYKKRMQQFRLLQRAGTAALSRHRRHEAPAALERFLTLEAAGWKGKSGTALANRPADAGYFRDLVARFAAQDAVRIDLLLLDGEPIAAGVLLDLAGTVTFLKIAYDESHARLSPGRALAIAMLQADLAGSPPALFDSGAGDRVDASTYVWAERRDMAHALVALGGRHALLPRLLLRARMWLRDRRDAARG